MGGRTSIHLVDPAGTTVMEILKDRKNLSKTALVSAAMLAHYPVKN